MQLFFKMKGWNIGQCFLLLSLFNKLVTKKIRCSSESRCACLLLEKNLYEAHCVGLGLNSSTFPRFYNNVVDIDLTDNNIVDLPQPLYKYIPETLVILKLYDNGLRKIKNDTFVRLNSLKIISLAENHISEIEGGSFELPSLQHLNLSFNNHLTFRVFQNISRDLQSTNIKELVMDHIHCETGVTTIIFASDVKDLKNTSLQKLYLKGNRIGFLEKSVFEVLPQTLSYIDISDNYLVPGPYIFTFQLLKGIQELYVANRNLGGPGAWEECSDWRGPQHKTDISQLYQNKGKNRVFYNLPPNLKIAVLNNLGYGNELLPYAFNADNRLETLSLTKNDIWIWNATIKNLHQLKHLDLSSNGGYYIGSGVFSEVPNLRTLKLNDNDLNEALNHDSKVFSYLHWLQYLEVKNNHLISLPSDLFQDLFSLESLDLSSNFLHEWNCSMHSLKRLKYLDLSSNRLSTFQKKTMIEIDEIKTHSDLHINITNNVLECTCNNVNFLKWVLMNSKYFVNFNSTSCFNASRQKLYFTKLSDEIGYLESTCSSNAYTGLALGVLAAVIISITIITAGLIYRFRWRLRYMYYMAKMKHGKPSEMQRKDNQYTFDAFISYANEDSDFVEGTLTDVLENNYQLKLQIHARDFLGGKPIAENITDAVHNSRKTVVILSFYYLRSYWCMFEFNIARMEGAFARGDEDVIVIVPLEKMKSRYIPLQMMDLLARDTYLQYNVNDTNDNEFWNNLNKAIRS